MKKLKSFLCIVLTAVILISCMSACAFAAESEEDRTPVVFVDGIFSSDIIFAESGENAFVPSTQAILSAVKDVIVPLGEGIATKDYSKLGEPISDALVTLFNNIACDENGEPIYDTISSYTIPDAETILSGKIAINSKNLGFDAPEVVHFSYDWRLDMQTIASQLHNCIEAVLSATGAEKVNLVGFSMGTCVVSTYLHDYDYQYIDGVVMLSGGFNGVTTCSEPFSGQIAFNSDGMVTFLKTMLGSEISDILLKSLISTLYSTGILTDVLDIAQEMNYAILDDVFEKGLKTTFAKMAGIWALIGQNEYESAKTLLIGDNVSDKFIEKIDYYHYEIQANNKAILDKAIEKGINVGIISKYGSTIPPVCVSQMNIGDSVIDTINTSFGATCAKADSSLGDNYIQKIDCGHNHISADNMIDASTCAYPEYTWFIKDLMHSDHTQSQWELIRFIFASENQPTVSDNSSYSQFLINIDNELYPLTVNNDSDKYGKTEIKNIFEKIVDIIKNFISKIMALLK